MIWPGAGPVADRRPDRRREHERELLVVLVERVLGVGTVTVFVVSPGREGQGSALRRVVTRRDRGPVRGRVADRDGGAPGGAERHAEGRVGAFVSGRVPDRDRVADDAEDDRSSPSSGRRSGGPSRARRRARPRRTPVTDVPVAIDEALALRRREARQRRDLQRAAERDRAEHLELVVTGARRRAADLDRERAARVRYGPSTRRIPGETPGANVPLFVAAPFTVPVPATRPVFVSAPVDSNVLPVSTVERAGVRERARRGRASGRR